MKTSPAPAHSPEVGATLQRMRLEHDLTHDVDERGVHVKGNELEATEFDWGDDALAR